MRGKDAHVVTVKDTIGITPAYAGKSVPQAQSGNRLWDHPRVCGEKLQACRSTLHILGSPPRMRGKGGQTT